MRPKGQIDYHRRLTTAQVRLVSVIVLGFGIFVLWLAQVWVWLSQHTVVQALTQDAGNLLVGTVAVALIIDLATRRTFLDEIYARVGLNADLRDAGISRYHRSFEDVDWDVLFRDANKLDMFFIFGRRWMGKNQGHLRTLSGTKGATIRVVLPDPEDKLVVDELGRRMDQDPEDIKREIRDAVKFFAQLSPQKGQRQAEIEIWYASTVPFFTCYRFNRHIVMALRSHRRERLDAVPALELAEGGDLYHFLEEDFAGITNEDTGLARRQQEGDVETTDTPTTVTR